MLRLRLRQLLFIVISSQMFNITNGKITKVHTTADDFAKVSSHKSVRHLWQIVCPRASVQLAF